MAFKVAQEAFYRHDFAFLSKRALVAVLWRITHESDRYQRVSTPMFYSALDACMHIV
jgi:hypothetical protein